MFARLSAVALVAAAACAGRAPRAASPPQEGMLAGMIRTADTGAPVTDAVIVLRRPGALAPVEEHTSGTGAYMVPRLPPGAYDVKVYRDERTIGDQQVSIEAGRVTGLDLAVAPPGSDAPAIPLDIADAAPLWRYRPAGGDPQVGAIEGTITEQGGRTRLGGAVVTVADAAGALIADAVTDDDGRYRIEPVPPGAYVVSAYYTVVGRGQFEIRRNDVTIGGGEVVVVPLAIETEH